MESLADVARTIAVAAAGTSVDQFSQAGSALVRVRDEIREELQQLTAGAMKPIIGKLEKKQDLSVEDKDLVRLWIVGDAAAFTKKENDYRVWLEEFKRLGEAIAAKGGIPASLPEMLDLSGNLKEAVRLAGDLQFFLEEKERVARFEQAIQNLSGAQSEMLAGILREKLNSPDM